jgi:HK97 family phage portal protein
MPVSQTPGALFRQPTSTAGVSVGPEEALSLSGVFAAVQLLSSVIAALPLKVYRKDGAAREEQSDRPEALILGKEANPEQTAFMHRRTREMHRILWGNAYSEIGWRGNGQAAALWTVEPWRVKPERDEAGSLFYRVDGGRKVAPADMLHTTLFSLDGVCGRSFVDYALESLGLGIASQQFAASFFGNGARPGAILKHAMKQDPDAVKKFRSQWNDRHQGSAKAGGTAVLTGGWEYEADGSFDPEAMQLIEQRRFGVEEVARWLGIPPHLLRDLSRATFSNIEQQGIDFTTYTLGPPLVNEEQENNRKLLGTRSGLYCKHELKGLLRGDSAARAALYNTMFQVGAASPNEIRASEDENPVEGGDERFVPRNMMPLSQALLPPQPAPQPTPSGDGKPQDKPAPPGLSQAKAVEAMRSVLASTLDRMARVEGNAVERLAGKGASGFLAGIEALYAKHVQTLSEAVTSPIMAAESMGLAVSGDGCLLARAWCDKSKADLLALSGQVGASGLAGVVEKWAQHLHGLRPSACAGEWIGGAA